MISSALFLFSELNSNGKVVLSSFVSLCTDMMEEDLFAMWVVAVALTGMEEIRRDNIVNN